MQQGVLSQQGERHIVLSCYDSRLDPTISAFEASLREQGVEVLPSIRPVGGIHAMVRSTCREFFYDQLDGAVIIGKATHIHAFPHTNCQFNWLKRREKVGDTVHQDLCFQISTLKKVLQGGQDHLEEKYPSQRVSLDVRIILTAEQRIITLEEAEELQRSDDHHHSHSSLNEQSAFSEASAG